MESVLVRLNRTVQYRKLETLKVGTVYNASDFAVAQTAFGRAITCILDNQHKIYLPQRYSSQIHKAELACLNAQSGVSLTYRGKVLCKATGRLSNVLVFDCYE